MATDAMALKRIDHVRMFVGNARQSAYFYRNAFGFDVIAYAGLETGVRHEASYVLRQGDITFVLASPLRADHPDAERLVRHGDGVQSIALEVDDVPAAFEAAVARGAAGGAAAHHRGRIRHVRIRRDPRLRRHDAHASSTARAYHGVFAPGYQAARPRSLQPAHVPPGRPARPSTTSSPTSKRARWATGSITTARSWASRCWPASTTRTSAPITRRSMSKVVADGRGRIKFPINEPATGRRRSQIEEFLDFYGGPGVQHIALATGDIIESVRAMAANDVSFLKVPPAYYELLPDRVGTINEDMHELAELGILVDRDEEGYLLQIFTKPVEDRPTLFFEIIQRRGARSFGKGNFKALFEAIEREQARRGTLVRRSPMRTYRCPPITSIRDFYAFEQHVATCRRQRGLDMVPQWYQVPVFYFSNPAGVIGHEAEVWAPRGSEALDYELELACVIGREARDLPDDDRALEAVAGFTIMNDWSARDLQRIEMAVGLGPSKGKDFATSLGPELVTLRRAGRPLPRRPAAPGDDREPSTAACCRGATRVPCTGPGRSCWRTPAATRRSGPAT